MRLYINKSKVECLLPIDNALREVTASNLKIFKEVDLIWILSHYYKVQNTPM